MEIQNRNMYVMPMRIRIALFFALCLHSVLFAQADTVHLTIEASGLEALPVGVVEFEVEKESSNLLSELPHVTLERDFTLSGRIAPVVLQKFQRVALHKAKALYFVSGSVALLPDGKLKVESFLKAALSGQILLGQSYEVSPNLLRKSMHHFASLVMQQLTGAPGVTLTKLAFVGKVDGKKKIFLADYDGFGRKQVTQGSEIHFMPTWGSTMGSLYYSVFSDTGSHLVEKMLATGKTRVLFSHLGQVYSPAVNPYTGDIAFTVLRNGNADIWKGNPATGKVTRLTYQETAETSPSWSPNGKEILYTSDRGQSPQIYLMEQDGSNGGRRISFTGRYNESAQWSPEAKRIAYVSIEGGEANIFTCEADGSDVVQLTSSAGHNEHPVWSPDGMLIAFSSTRSGSSQIYIMRKDGSAVTRLTQGGAFTWPTWSPQPEILPQLPTKENP